MVDENSQQSNFQVQTIVHEAYVTGVEAWTQLVYKPGPTFDIIGMRMVTGVEKWIKVASV